MFLCHWENTSSFSISFRRKHRTPGVSLLCAGLMNVLNRTYLVGWFVGYCSFQVGDGDVK